MAVDAKAELTERPERREVAATAGLDERLKQLPAGHPSAQGHAEHVREADGADGGRPDPADNRQRERDADAGRPLSDVEHVAQVEGRLADARKAGFGTDSVHKIDSAKEIWTDERRDAHDAVIDDLYAAASAVPCEHRAIVAGGLPGAGKTTVLGGHAGIDLASYFTINPDGIKEEMARRGLVPEVEGLTPMEAADLVHEESSYIAKRLANRAQADGRNVIWDVTMCKPLSAEARIDSLRATGYTQVEGIFVDVPVDVSVRRADARYRQGHDAFRAGEGLGGRYVPADMIRAQADPDWGSANRRCFEQIKDRFDSWKRFDNSVDERAPLLADAGEQTDPGSRRMRL
jgi:predicted kinase